MTKLLKHFLVILLIGFISCQNAKVEKNIKMYSDTWDEIINKGNLDLINEDNFTSDITMIYSPENVFGIEDFKNYYSNFVTGFSDIEFTIKNIFGQDDNIVKHWHFKGTHSGEFFGIPPTGKSIDIEGTTLVKMKDGKIAQEQDFMDNAIFMQQLGLVSDPNNLPLIDNLYKAFAIGDIPTVLGGMDANIVWNEAESNKYADSNPYLGPDAVLNGVFARIVAEHEFFKLKDIELHEMSNNQVLATLRYDPKYKNGKAYDAQVAHFWTLKDGKVIAFQQYVDTKKLADAEEK